MPYSSEIVSGKFIKHAEIALTLAGILFTSLATLVLLRQMGFLLDQNTIYGLSIVVIGQTVLIGILLMLTDRNIVYRLIILDGPKPYSPHLLNEFGFESSGIDRDLYKKQLTNRIMSVA